MLLLLTAVLVVVGGVPEAEVEGEAAYQRSSTLSGEVG